MSERPRRRAGHAAKRLVLTALLTAFLVAVTGVLTARAASASSFSHPETRAAAIEHPAGHFVGPHSSVLAGESRQRAPSYDRYATGSSVAAEGGVAAEGDDSITLYHGSVDNYSSIVDNGLDPSRGPTWVTTDPDAAANAIGSGRVLSSGQGLDSGVVSSTISRSDFYALDDPADVGGLTNPRTWPGFGGGGPYQEFVLRSERAILLFNSGIGS